MILHVADELQFVGKVGGNKSVEQLPEQVDQHLDSLQAALGTDGQTIYRIQDDPRVFWLRDQKRQKVFRLRFPTCFPAKPSSVPLPALAVVASSPPAKEKKLSVISLIPISLSTARRLPISKSFNKRRMETALGRCCLESVHHSGKLQQ